MSASLNVLGLLSWLVLTYAAAALGARVTGPAIGTWYAQLRKPSFNPPNWVFGPVWGALYTLMAISAWLVWRRAGTAVVAPALLLYLVQLALNSVWSWLFFGRHNPGRALVDLAALWCLILATMLAFWRVLPGAGMLLLPYLAWVSFAAVLNYALWRLNLPGAHSADGK